MAGRQIILFLLIVCLPLAMLAWLGSRLARDEQEVVRQRFRELLTEKLEDADQVAVEFFGQQQRDLLEMTELTDFTPDHLRQIVRREPSVDQLFVLGADGTLLHPDPAAALTTAEREFLLQTKQVFLDKDLIRSKAEEDGNPAVAARYGWHLRYWGPGLNLIFYRRVESGQVVGVLLQRSRWIADLIAELPQTDPPGPSEDESPSQMRIRLVDSNAATVYQWGLFEPDAEARPAAEIPLSDPLGPWRLQCFVDHRRFAAVGKSSYFGLFSALAAIAVCLIIAAVYFYREYARQVREALQRVNFVNQVSHELKTPLTSIRMYAELLENDLELLDEDETAKARDRIKVIVTESQRLGRLIANVLTFARGQRDKLSLRKTTGRVDEVIARVIDHFTPAFGQRGIEIQFDGSADSPVRLDVDAVEQILGNLLGNVEKYAADGRSVEIVSRQQNDRTTIEVADRGPGIPVHLRETVFRPFYRISDRLEAGTGTGIGLSIARKLAQLHGGDVTLLDSETGARFQVQLLTVRDHESEAESETPP